MADGAAARSAPQLATGGKADPYPLADTDDVVLCEGMSPDLVEGAMARLGPPFSPAYRGEARRAAIVLELDVTDIFDNIEDACFACRLARKRGYRICLTGANARLARSIDWGRLSFDWLVIVQGSATATRPADLAGTVERSGSGRLILSGADSRTAIDFGAAAGVELFQGRYVDRALREDARLRHLRAGPPHG